MARGQPLWPGTRGLVPEPVLQWLEERQLLALCQSTALEALEWGLLAKGTFPVLMSLRAASMARQAQVSELLDRNDQLYLLTDNVAPDRLQQMAERYAHRMLLGSGPTCGELGNRRRPLSA